MYFGNRPKTQKLPAILSNHQTILSQIGTALRKTGKPECLRKAEILEGDENQTRSLSLRNLGLEANDMTAIAEILAQAKLMNEDFLESISFSYNGLIGDTGARLLAQSLPNSIREIGLVGCSIGDKGGAAILGWAKTGPNLRMICIEQNNFSDQLRLEYKAFKQINPHALVVC